MKTNPWKPGDLLAVRHANNTRLRTGELVVVIDGNRLPTLRDELRYKAGSAYWEFVCIQGLEKDHAGFYSWARFQRPKNVAVA